MRRRGSRQRCGPVKQLPRQKNPCDTLCRLRHLKWEISQEVVDKSSHQARLRLRDFRAGTTPIPAILRDHKLGNPYRSKNVLCSRLQEAILHVPGSSLHQKRRTKHKTWTLKTPISHLSQQKLVGLQKIWFHLLIQKWIWTKTIHSPRHRPNFVQISRNPLNRFTNGKTLKKPHRLIRLRNPHLPRR